MEALSWNSHPVDLLKHFGAVMDPLIEQQLRAICDEPMNNEINFTPAKVEALQRAYDLAVEIKARAFTFEGEIIGTAFAKYLLECLATKFPSTKE